MDECMQLLIDGIDSGLDLQNLIPSERISKLIITRLEMQVPFMSKWPQALSIQAHPMNVPASFKQWIQQEEARVHSHDDNEGLARTLQDLEGNLQLSVSDDEKLARYLQQADELNHSCISQRDGPSTSRAVSHYDDDDHFLGHHIHTHTSSNISISSQNVDANEITDPESMTYEEMNELEDSIGDVSRGLSEGRIFQLRTHKYGTKTKTRWWQIKKKKFIATDTQCSICLVEYMNGDNITTLPCNHIYHKDCISRWLRENKICCICKADV